MGFYTLSPLGPVCVWGGGGSVSQEPSARKRQPEWSGGQVATGPREGHGRGCGRGLAGLWAGLAGAGQVFPRGRAGMKAS